MDGRQAAALALALFTATLIYGRRVLVLNRLQWPPRAHHAITYGLSLTAGTLFWVSVNSVRRSLWLQLCTGLVSTTLAWSVLVLVLNERLQYPSAQQWMSLGFYVCTELSILVQVRLLLS